MPIRSTQSTRNFSRVCPAVTQERRENKNKIQSAQSGQPISGKANLVKQILICNHPGCQARALPLPDGTFLERCYDHVNSDERAHYLKQWNVS